MPQLSVPFEEKLDMPLAELCNANGIKSSERVPVVIRAAHGMLDSVQADVERLGGMVRHRLDLLSGLAAWVPLASIPEISSNHDVSRLELVQSFTIA
jgi:hypothetical protein